MKRLHIHLNVKDIDQSITYYTALFGAEPVRREADYAKWMLDEPSANIAISSHGRKSGIDHVGVSLDSREDLDAVADRLNAITAPLTPQEDASCCYARSDKYWSHDPQGAVWELFFTFADSDTYGETGENPQHAPATACCSPAA
ncbi:ArsI/CadI family heavy metal resistance metalloenzyme [Hyphococcus sp.]|uniref:ArsI/CadI family heavy metal resistance metalloenzyme n=1 Tax=Hyphococcus sp. TaxID=2038636 RepID=UPI003CCBBE62